MPIGRQQAMQAPRTTRQACYAPVRQIRGLEAHVNGTRPKALLPESKQGVWGRHAPALMRPPSLTHEQFLLTD